MDELPYELIDIIVQYMDIESLFTARALNTMFRKQIMHDEFWRDALLRQLLSITKHSTCKTESQEAKIMRRSYSKKCKATQQGYMKLSLKAIATVTRTRPADMAARILEGETGSLMDILDTSVLLPASKTLHVFFQEKCDFNRICKNEDLTVQQKAAILCHISTKFNILVNDIIYMAIVSPDSVALVDAIKEIMFAGANGTFRDLVCGYRYYGLTLLGYLLAPHVTPKVIDYIIETSGQPAEVYLNQTVHLNREHKTPLYHVCEKYEDTALYNSVKHLLSRGANPNVTAGRSALMELSSRVINENILQTVIELVKSYEADLKYTTTFDSLGLHMKHIRIHNMAVLIIDHTNNNTYTYDLLDVLLEHEYFLVAKNLLHLLNNTQHRIQYALARPSKEYRSVQWLVGNNYPVNLQKEVDGVKLRI
jgi:hypothetical protein